MKKAKNQKNQNQKRKFMMIINQIIMNNLVLNLKKHLVIQTYSKIKINLIKFMAR